MNKDKYQKYRYIVYYVTVTGVKIWSKLSLYKLCNVCVLCPCVRGWGEVVGSRKCAYDIKSCSLNALTSWCPNTYYSTSVHWVFWTWDFSGWRCCCSHRFNLSNFSPLRHNQLNKCPLNIYSRLFIERQCHFQGKINAT